MTRDADAHACLHGPCSGVCAIRGDGCIDTGAWLLHGSLLAAGRAYPASIVTHGQALIITCQSYAGAMNFGFTGCHSSQPGMQHLAVYAAAALKDLENAIPPRPKRAPRAASRARPAGKAPRKKVAAKTE